MLKRFLSDSYSSLILAAELERHLPIIVVCWGESEGMMNIERTMVSTVNAIHSLDMLPGLLTLDHTL